MRRCSDHDPEGVIDGLVRADPEPKPSNESEAGKRYRNAVNEMLEHLAKFSPNPPDLKGMGRGERRDYVTAYSLPFVRAEVPADVFWALGEGQKGGVPGEAVIRWMERPGPGYFPRNPGELLSVCLVVVRERFVRELRPAPALEGPRVTRQGAEGYARVGNPFRLKCDLPLLPEE